MGNTHSNRVSADPFAATNNQSEVDIICGSDDLEKMKVLQHALEKEVVGLEQDINSTEKSIILKRKCVEDIDIVISDLGDKNIYQHLGGTHTLKEQYEKRDFAKQKLLDEISLKTALVKKILALRLRLIDLNRQIVSLESVKAPPA